MANLSRIAPELPVSSLKESIDYYEQKLGFQLVTQLSDYAIVERDNVAIHLFQDGARKHTPVGVHIFTPDLEALHAEFEQRGAHLSQKILHKPWGNRDFRVKDVFGNDADIFRPERWIEADPSTRAKYERTTEVIFGSGRYVCLGKNIAWIELSKAFVEV